MVVSEFGVNAKKGYTRVSGCCWCNGQEDIFWRTLCHLVAIDHLLNTAVNLNIVSPNVGPFMTTVCPSSVPCHKHQTIPN